MAKLASIHIHFRTPKDVFNRINRLYQFEYLFPLLYSNSREKELHCFRPILYDNNFTYNLNGYPKIIPTSIDVINLEKCNKEFIRDYSFICIRDDQNTIEFRGNDTTIDVEVIKEVIALRIAILTLVSQPIKINKSNLRDKYFETCKNKYFDKNILLIHYQLLMKVSLADQFKKYLQLVLRKLSHHLN